VSVVTIVVAVVWNALLLVALAAVVSRRRQVLRWVTGLDREPRNRGDMGDDGAWSAFLAEHPELFSGDGGEHAPRAADRSAEYRHRSSRGWEPRP
jgi:hypothetical protein